MEAKKFMKIMRSFYNVFPSRSTFEWKVNGRDGRFTRFRIDFDHPDLSFFCDYSTRHDHIIVHWYGASNDLPYGLFDSVNQFHQRKATDIFEDFNKQPDVFVNRLTKIMDMLDKGTLYS